MFSEKISPFVIITVLIIFSQSALALYSDRLARIFPSPQHTTEQPSAVNEHSSRGRSVSNTRTETHNPPNRRSHSSLLPVSPTNPNEAPDIAGAFDAPGGEAKLFFSSTNQMRRKN